MVTDAAKRVVYVALTRAKSQLQVHYCGSFMEGRPLPGIQYEQDMNFYPEPNEIVLQLGHRDVVLNFFKGKKGKILRMRSGDELQCEGNYLQTEGANAFRVVKFSQKCQGQLAALNAKGYRIQRAEIRFIMAWKGEEDEEESAIILPSLFFAK